MATDFRVVIPADLGSTIVLGAKEPNKYDVANAVTKPTRDIRLVNATGTTVVGYIYSSES